jgi:F-type H+-transporting ATPase subunit b
MKLFFITALLHLSANLAVASGPNDSHEGSLLLPAVNFAMYIALAVYLLKTPVRSAVFGRRATFEVELKKSQAELDAAKAKMTLAEQQLSNLSAESKKIKERIQIDAEMEADTIVSQAKERATRVVAQGKSLAAAELKASHESIKKELIRASINKARALAASQSNDATDKLLRDRAASDVSGILNG